jgi:hypothetical protein
VTPRWLAPLAAALTAVALAVPTLLTAAPTGAPAMMVPPGRTQPTGPLLAWDGSSPPAALGDFVWCEGDAETGGCRGFNADDFAITYWVRQHVIDPYLAANPQATATAVPTPIPMATATTTATPPAAAASPTAAPATATTVPSPVPGPLATVVCLSAQFADGVLTCVPQE